MRLSLVALALTLCATPVRGQCDVILVPNGGFEEYSECPTANGQIAYALPWLSPTTGTSDYYNACDETLDNVGVPENAVGVQEAFEGQAYAGFIALAPASLPDYREYIQAPLTEALAAGQTYRFSMRWSLAEDSSAATDRLGAHLSSTPISSTDWFTLPVTPQVESPLGTFLDELDEWETLTGTFLADGTETYVTIGNFHDAADSGTIPAGFGPEPPLQLGIAYYYVDDVSIVCEPCAHPPDDLNAWWTLDDATVGLAYEMVYGNHGVHVGTPTPLPAGFVEGGLDLGTGGSVSTPSAPQFEAGELGFSWDFLVRPDALGTQQALVVKLASDAPYTSPGYAIVLEADGTVTATLVNEALVGASGTSVEALAPGEWSHVVVAIDRDDPAGGQIWINGSLTTFDSTGAIGSVTNALPLHFGTDGGAGLGADFTGSLDEMAFYVRALFPYEVEYVTGMYTSGKCRIFLEVPEVEVEEETPDVTPTVGVTATLVTSAGPTVGTYTISARGEPAGTRVGRLVSTVDGPLHVDVLSPQPLQVHDGHPMPIRLEMDIPRTLRAGLAAFTITTTHLETGRRVISRGLLRGTKRLGSGLQPR